MKRSRLKRSPFKKRKRKVSETLRIYGTPERRGWVTAQPCIVCVVVPSVNMHIENGGTGRKANADKVVPCCDYHHRMSHYKGIETFSRLYKLDLDRLAANTELAWRMHLEGEDELCVACRASFRVRDFLCVACRWEQAPCEPRAS